MFGLFGMQLTASTGSIWTIGFDPDGDLIISIYHHEIVGTARTVPSANLMITVHDVPVDLGADKR